MSEERKPVRDFQLEEGGAVFDLNYLPAFVREVGRLLVLRSQVPMSTSARVSGSLDSVEHLWGMLVKKDEGCA